MKDPHPLRDAQITPVDPDPYPLTPTDEKLQRLARGAPGRALPTAETMAREHRPDLRWRRANPPRTGGQPKIIFAPSDLEKSDTSEEQSAPDFGELLDRWRRR